MSQHLRPRRGKKATAISELINNNTLERGEIFFEVPDTGVGTGAGKIKMGDGVTGYEDLPYFVGEGGGGDTRDLEDFVGYPGELSPTHIDHETQLANLDSTRMKIDGSNAEDIVTFPGSFSQGLNNIAGSLWESISTLPYDFYYGSAVVYNNEIHILGSSNSSYYKYHYKWNGETWQSVSTLPYNFYYGSAVVYNNEIHIMGSSSSYRKYHYKWNGEAWESASTLPYDFYEGSAVVYNNEIHILGTISNGSYYRYHYKWNGETWESASTLPYQFYYGSAVVYNNEIHIMGTGYNSSYYKYHYKWNGQTWQSVSTLPYDFYYGEVVVYNNEIHIMGSSSNSSYYRYHYKWNGQSWQSVSTLPSYFFNGSAVVYNNEIHILGSGNGNYCKSHYKYNGQVSNNYSHAEGYDTKATANYSHAEGYNTQANGNYSHAEGYGTTVTAHYSHAEGYNNNAGGGYNYCHVEGYNNRSNDSYCHTEGANCLSNYSGAHAEGYNSTANGYYSHAGGYYGYTLNRASFVQGGGQWNNPLNITNGTTVYKRFGVSPYPRVSTATEEMGVDYCKNGISGIIKNGDYTITLNLESCAIYILFCISYTKSSGAIYGYTARMISANGLETGTPTNSSLGQTTNAPATISLAASNKLTIRSGTAARSVEYHLIRIL